MIVELLPHDAAIGPLQATMRQARCMLFWRSRTRLAEGDCLIVLGRTAATTKPLEMVELEKTELL
jgi:hypothetical protein